MKEDPVVHHDDHDCAQRQAPQVLLILSLEGFLVLNLHFLIFKLDEHILVHELLKPAFPLHEPGTPLPENLPTGFPLRIVQTPAAGSSLR